MLERGKRDRDLVEFVVIDQLVPAEHLLRKIDAAVDFDRIYEMVDILYSEDNGRPSVDPVVLFKVVLIQHLYGLPSLRRTADEISANICYRWFLGYTLQEETPHFSTVSYNFRHRFTAETVDQVFAWILEEVAEAGYLSPKAVFIDGTHIKPLSGIGTQVHTLRAVIGFQIAVLDNLPFMPPDFTILLVIPVNRILLVAFPPAGWQLYPFPILVKVINLAALGKPFPMFVHCPHSQQDMGVGIVSRRMGVMDGKISNHAF